MIGSLQDPGSIGLARAPELSLGCICRLNLSEKVMKASQEIAMMRERASSRPKISTGKREQDTTTDISDSVSQAIQPAEDPQSIQPDSDSDGSMESTDSCTKSPDSSSRARHRSDSRARTSAGSTAKIDDGEGDTPPVMPLFERLESQADEGDESKEATELKRAILWAESSDKIAASIQSGAVAVSAAAERALKSFVAAMAPIFSCTKASGTKKTKKKGKQRRPSWVRAAGAPEYAPFSLRVAVAVAGLVDLTLFSLPLIVGMIWKNVLMQGNEGILGEWTGAFVLLWWLLVAAMNLFTCASGQSLGNVLTGTAITMTPAAAATSEEAFDLQEKPRAGLSHTVMAAFLTAFGMGLVYALFASALAEMMDSNYTRITWVSDAAKPSKSLKSMIAQPQISRQSSLQAIPSDGYDFDELARKPFWARRCNDWGWVLAFLGAHVAFWIASYPLVEADLQQQVSRTFNGLGTVFTAAASLEVSDIGAGVALYVMCSAVVLILMCVVRATARPVFWTCLQVLSVFAAGAGAYLAWTTIFDFLTPGPTNLLGMVYPLCAAAAMMAAPYAIYSWRGSINLTFECWRESILWLQCHPIYMLYLPSMELVWMSYQIVLLAAISILSRNMSSGTRIFSWSEHQPWTWTNPLGMRGSPQGQLALRLVALGYFLLGWTVCTMRCMMDIGISACFSQFHFEPGSRTTACSMFSFGSLKRSAHGVCVSSTTSFGTATALGLLGYINDRLGIMELRLRQAAKWFGEGLCKSCLLLLAWLISVLRWVVYHFKVTAGVFAGALGLNLYEGSVRTAQVMRSRTASVLVLSDSSWLFGGFGVMAVVLAHSQGGISTVKKLMASASGFQAIAQLPDLIVSVIFAYIICSCAWNLSVATKAAMICTVEELRMGRELVDMRASPPLVQAVFEYVEEQAAPTLKVGTTSNSGCCCC